MNQADLDRISRPLVHIQGRQIAHQLHYHIYMGITRHCGETTCRAHVAALGWQRQEGLARVAGGSDDTFGYALHLAQAGRKHDTAKPLHGFGPAGVLEVVEDWRGNTYRAVYAVRFSAALFVLHVFQKKAMRGIATPRHNVELIRERLKAAEQMAKELPR